MSAKDRQRIKNKRLRIFNRDGGVCYYCSKKLQIKVPGRKDYVTIEHKIRVTDGGTWHDDNLTIACARCNTSLGNILQGVTVAIENIVNLKYCPNNTKTKDSLQYIDRKVRRIVTRKYKKLGYRVKQTT